MAKKGLGSIGIRKISHGQISSQHISVTLEATTTGTGLEHNPFDEDFSSAFTTHSSRGITYTKENGRFTFSESGVYQITLVAYIDTSAISTFSEFGIRKNGTDFDISAAGTKIHNAVDPVERTISYMGSFLKGDYIEFIADITSGACSFSKGTTMNILRVG